MEDQNYGNDQEPRIPGGQENYPAEPFLEDRNVSMPPPVPPRPEHTIDDIPPLKPGNWLWQSIVATILCCLPFGIVGIIYAAKVDSLYYNGQYAESEQAAKKARLWTILAFVAGLVYVIVTVILFATGNIPDYMENIIENNASGYNF
jgi:Interferon-induced transmembrane protein.